MGLNFLFSKKERGKFFLCIDIGTEAVKALIFKVDKGRIVIVDASTQYFERYGAFDPSVSLISKAIEQVYHSFKKAERPKQDWKKSPILIGLPPNIFRARIIWETFKRERPEEKISKIEQKNIHQQVFNRAKKEISQKFAEEYGILPAELRWLTLKVLGVKIDGYSVAGFQGYEGKNLEIKILTTFLPRYYFENLERIFKSLNLKIFKIVHIAESLPIAFKDKEGDGIFFDVGGEVAQFFLLKEGELQQVCDFDAGAKVFSQRLAEVLGLSEESARILKERYSDKLLSVEAEKRIKEILLPEKRSWTENLKLKISRVNLEGFLPLTIFLFGGGSLLPEIRESFFGNAKLIYPKDLKKDIEDLTKKLKSPQYIPSLLIGYYAKKIL